MRCTYRACAVPARWKLYPPNGGDPWYSCQRHLDGMVEGLKWGCASSLGVDVARLPKDA
jgi:hypothetical protein